MARNIQRAESRAASVAGPLYLLLFPIPIVCFLAALATDIAYSLSAFLMWLQFSQWLIAAGLAFGALAAIVLLIEFVARDAIRSGKSGWAHLLLFYACLIVELLNAFIHTIDGWTAVVPIGMMLSIAGVIFALGAVTTLIVVPVTWVGHREARA